MDISINMMKWKKTRHNISPSVSRNTFRVNCTYKKNLHLCFSPLQFNKHLFVHIGQSNPSYSDPYLESVDIRQIYDKFPEKKGGLKELFDKGPHNAFFLVKFWVKHLLAFVIFIFSKPLEREFFIHFQIINQCFVYNTVMGALCKAISV